MALDEELDLPRPFGAYTLARRLAVGGMAEVYVGKTKGFGGFEKLVAIKVIHPRYSEDDHFIQMLVEEAKISVLLNHVNIAQTFDLGCIDDTYYIVMEFIEGADAYRVMRKASEIKRAIPIDLAAYITAEVCNGLDYAHRKRDSEGRPLGIVHRDISPQNLLISYAGEVKIVDFGIAKAASRGTQTEVGVIKGKYYYMSPEQAWGDPMDHRSDIFSAGVCLYELLTGRMLYNEDNVPLLLDKVRKAEITPPDARRRSVPKALSDICMRALSKEPRDRYQSAGEMQQALTQFLYSTSPTFTASRLAELMGTLFPNEVQRHSAIVKLPSVEEPLGREPTEAAKSSAAVLFELAAEEDEEDDATRNDILPFRKAKLAAAKPPDSGEAPLPPRSEPVARPTFRPPRMSAVTAETAVPRADVAAPKVGADGAWVSPISSIDAVTTNPRRASEEPTDDTEAAAEWDDPTKLKDEQWEDDATVVDTDGLAAAMKALGVRGEKSVRSERGAVNFAKPAARLGKSDTSSPTASAAGIEPRSPNGAKPASVRPPPPANAAWSKPPQPIAAPRALPAQPAKSSGSAPGWPAAQAPQPSQQPQQFAQPPPQQPPQQYGQQYGQQPPQQYGQPPQMPPQMPQPQGSRSGSAQNWPAAAAPPPPQPRASQSSQSLPAQPRVSPSSQSLPAQPQQRAPSSSSSSPVWPAASSGAQPIGPPSSGSQQASSSGSQQVPYSSSGQQSIPSSSGGHVIAASGSQPLHSSGGFVTPGHVSGSFPGSDPFAPPPPRGPGTTGGFEPVEAKASRRNAVVAGIVALAIVVLGAIALAVSFGGAPPPALEIISSPTGARVLIDGRAIDGVTPLTVTDGIESGHSYRVEVVMPGYTPWAAQLAPTGGAMRQFVVLAPLPASLRVETDPVGAQVMVNGVSRGPSPIEVSGLFVGQDVEVRAIVPGRVPVIRQVRIGEGTTTERILVASP